jgi:hypothetical protein
MSRDPVDLLRSQDQRIERLERDLRSDVPNTAEVMTEDWELIAEVWWETTETLSWSVTVPGGSFQEVPNSWRLVKLAEDGTTLVDLTGSSSSSSTVTNAAGDPVTVQLMVRGDGEFAFSATLP